MKELRYGLTIALFVYFFALIIYTDSQVNAAQIGMDIVWSPPKNVSKSPLNTSTDPFLLSDPTGKVHLFWSEKVSAIEGNQPDTLLYTVWDGKNLHKSIDIFFAPESDGNLVINYPHAAIDENGTIHLVWLQQPNFPNYTLYYSSAFAPDALLADSWSPQIALATDLSGTEYSIDIASRGEKELHVIYARGQQGEGAKEERAVAYMRSLDGGQSWSDPMDIATIWRIQNGANQTRILVDGEERIYATWIEWGISGNGYSVNFARSIDNGNTWEKPIVLSTVQDNEYERDWPNIQVLGPDRLVVMWEGGWRAYRNAQYSDDGGITWSTPIDTFPWLIGENGTVEFAVDSNAQLHLFIAQRVREGYLGYGDDANAAVWHSIWEGGRKWSEPQIVTPAVNLINPKAVITGGNQVVLTWYTQRDLEIFVMTGQIQGAPYVTQPGWARPTITAPTQTNQVTGEPTQATTFPSTPTSTPPTNPDEGPVRINEYRVLLLAVFPALLLIGIVFLMFRKNR